MHPTLPPLSLCILCCCFPRPNCISLDWFFRSLRQLVLYTMCCCLFWFREHDWMNLIIGCLIERCARKLCMIPSATTITAHLAQTYSPKLRWPACCFDITLWCYLSDAAAEFLAPNFKNAFVLYLHFGFACTRFHPPIKVTRAMQISNTI